LNSKQKLYICSASMVTGLYGCPCPRAEASDDLD
jgi:hypothetical protein